MRVSPAVWWFVLGVLGGVGCGDKEFHTLEIDAHAAPDAPAIDAPQPPAHCDYVEASDLTNDDVPPATGAPEQTGLTFASRTVVCGTFDSTHFDGDITVDIDGYLVTLAADADVVVTLHGAGAESVELVGLDIYTGPNLTTRVGGNTFYGDHGVTAVHLAAGSYELAAFALSGAAITAPIAYEIRVVADQPAARCPELTTGGYAEANDGAASTGNDMVRIASGAPPALTASTTDVPEPSGLVIEPAASALLTGSAADITTPDQYEDKDTFAFTTGATTNELAVRLTWPGATANLDYFVFEENTADPIVRATLVGPAPELTLFPVKPNTAYWLLIGAKVGATGLPASYGATVCGASFTP
jgi:hypothetical protein